MKTVDISPLIPGVIKIILIATALGQFGHLRDFAKREFMRSLTSQGWHSAPFFPANYGRRHLSAGN